MEYNLKKLVASMWEHRKNKDFERKSLESSYRGLSVKASIGMTGNIAKIPWISYCADGQETQKGIYPVLLFYGTPEFVERNNNHTTVKKIVLAYGVSATNAPDILWGAEVQNKKTIGDLFADWKYETSDNGIKKYNSSYVYKSYAWTNDIDYDIIQRDIDSLISIYLDILENVSVKSSQTTPLNKKSFNARVYSKVYVTPSMFSYRPYITAIKSKPFLLLAGISGTGKSRIVRELARACWEESSEEYKAQNPKNFEMVQVKPNWHDSSELIGYVSRVSGSPVFVAGDFLKFVAKAWENPEVPYFLCLDEMNLAPVEQYFAEYLSVVESRKADDNGVITTDSILKKCEEQWYFDLTAQLTRDDEVRARFNKDGIAIPQNLIVVGTVNMDETTFSFSRKVLDRAMTIEMNEVDLYGGLDDRHEKIGKLEAGNLIGTAVEGVDVYRENKEVCDTALKYLQAINLNLEGTPFKVAYRTRNEFLLYVVNNLPYNKDSKGNALSQDYVIARALDEITNMKILSRVEGDETKVSASFLDGLENTIKTGLVTVCSNLFEEGEGKKAYVSVSLAKLTEMKKRLTSGYTSFWS
ncbi:MAG: restriction endonuclease [Bacteroidales bacterium]